MKVIHTFSAGAKGGSIPFNLMANAYLSAMYAKTHYGRVELYVSLPGYRSFFNCFGDDIPYDKIHILDTPEDKVFTWSTPKIEVYEKQKDPYLHIDLDTVMYRKLNLEGIKAPIVFSHLDMFVPPHSSSFQEGFNEMIIQGETDTLGAPGGLYQTYLNFFFKTINSYSKEEFQHFDCSGTPNMNFVYVENPEIMSKASSKALDIYQKYKTMFDSDRQSPCYIEQFLIHWFLRVLSPEYRDLSNEGKHVAFGTEPLEVNFEGDKLSSYSYLDINFNTLENSLSYNKVETENDKFNFIINKLGGFFHSTAYKNKPIVEANILYALKEVAGEEILQKLHRFHLMHRYNDSRPLLSEGQEIFEKYIQSDFFNMDVTEFKREEKNYNLKLV